MSTQPPCAVKRFFAKRRELEPDVDDEDIATSSDPYAVTFDVEKVSDVTEWMRKLGVSQVALDQHITIGPAPASEDE